MYRIIARVFDVIHVRPVHRGEDLRGFEQLPFGWVVM